MSDETQNNTFKRYSSLFVSDSISLVNGSKHVYLDSASLIFYKHIVLSLVLTS